MPKEAITHREVAVPQAVCYRAFSVLEDFPIWFDHLQSVRRTGPRTSVWTLKGDPPVVWQAETTQERPPSLYAWASTKGGVATYGAAEFEALAPSRTRITFRRFHGARVGEGARRLAARGLGDPQAKLEADLERFVRHLTAGAAPVKPVERGGFILGSPGTPAPRPAKVAQGVAFQRMGPGSTASGSSRGP